MTETMPPVFSRAAVKRYEQETGFVGLCDIAAELGRIRIQEEKE